MKALLLVLLLAGCGGGESPVAPSIRAVAPLKLLVHADDRISLDAGYDLHMQPMGETDPAASTMAQAKLPGKVMLWPGFTKRDGFATFPAFLVEARRYPNITHVYVYDELFWVDGQTRMGLDEAGVLQAARQARGAGFKPVVTIMPDVILDVGFTAQDLNAFDAIVLDPYPSARPSNPAKLGACRFNDSPYSNLLFCSIQKLRAMGYAGQVWYAWQAFGLHSETESDLRAKLAQQRETINDAGRMGVSMVTPWGLHLGPYILDYDPSLYPLAGTALEALVTP